MPLAVHTGMEWFEKLTHKLTPKAHPGSQVVKLMSEFKEVLLLVISALIAQQFLATHSISSIPLSLQAQDEQKKQEHVLVEKRKKEQR